MTFKRLSNYFSLSSYFSLVLYAFVFFFLYMFIFSFFFTPSFMYYCYYYFITIYCYTTTWDNIAYCECYNYTLLVKTTSTVSVMITTQEAGLLAPSHGVT